MMELEIILNVVGRESREMCKLFPNKFYVLHKQTVNHRFEMSQICKSKVFMMESISWLLNCRQKLMTLPLWPMNNRTRWNWGRVKVAKFIVGKGFVAFSSILILTSTLEFAASERCEIKVRCIGNAELGSYWRPIAICQTIVFIPEGVPACSHLPVTFSSNFPRVPKFSKSQISFSRTF